MGEKFIMYNTYIINILAIVISCICSVVGEITNKRIIGIIGMVTSITIVIINLLSLME